MNRCRSWIKNGALHLRENEDPGTRLLDEEKKPTWVPVVVLVYVEVGDFGKILNRPRGAQGWP